VLKKSISGVEKVIYLPLEMGGNLFNFFNLQQGIPGSNSNTIFGGTGTGVSKKNQ